LLHGGRGCSLLLLGIGDIVEIGENGGAVNLVLLLAIGARLRLIGGGAIDLLGSRFVLGPFGVNRRAGGGVIGSGASRRLLYDLGLERGFVSSSIVGYLLTGFYAVLLAMVVLGNLQDLTSPRLTMLDDFGSILAIVALAHRGFTYGPLLTDFVLNLLS
jgi:hypothetical protein